MTRAESAARATWVKYTAEHDGDFTITLQTVPHAGHKVNMKLRNQAADFLSGKIKAEKRSADFADWRGFQTLDPRA